MATSEEQKQMYKNRIYEVMCDLREYDVNLLISCLAKMWNINKKMAKYRYFGQAMRELMAEGKIERNTLKSIKTKGGHRRNDK